MLDGLARLGTGSANGVFLNGQRVDWRELDDGDEIAIGAFRLYYIRVRAEAASESPAGAGLAG